MFLDNVINLFLISTIVLTAYGVGNMFLSMMKIKLSNKEDFLFSSGIGLGIIAYLVLLLGELKLLFSSVILGLIILLLLLSFDRIYRFLKEVVKAVKDIKINELTFFEKALCAILLSAFGFSLLGALAPPIGNDALAYHLTHPKVFIQNHEIGYIPFTRESLWPYLVEMLFTLGMLLKGPVLAKLFHYLFGMLCTLAVFSFAGRYCSRKVALLASTLFYLSPGIFMQASYAYVDLALCFYIFTSLYLFFIWMDKKVTNLLVLSGVCSGLALSVKLLAGVGIIPIAILLIFELWRTKHGGKKILGATFLFSFVAFAAAFIWYLRSFAITGNPVYPFMYEIFGSGWTNEIGKHLGYVRGFFGFFRLPWDLVMHMESFGGEQIGFLFLAAMPSVFFMKWKDRGVQYLAFFVLAYTAIWFIVAPNIRFLFPIFPVIWLLLSGGLGEEIYIKKFKILKTFVIGALLFNLGLVVYYNLDPLMVFAGKITKEEYLAKKERAYKAASWINDNTGQDTLLVMVGEARSFYFNLPVVQYSLMERMAKDNFHTSFDSLIKSYKNVYLLIGGDKQSELIIEKIGSISPLFRAYYDEDGLHFQYQIYKIK